MSHQLATSIGSPSPTVQATDESDTTVHRDPTTANNGGDYLGLLSGNNLSVAAPNPTAVLSDQVPLCHWAISNAGRLALSLVK